ncbi:hypothetical protein Tco_0675842 [Tanacetum coccineum]
MGMEPDNENMTLNDYMEYKAKKERRFWNSVAPVWNRVLVYHDPDEEDKEYCWLPPLLPCFQTPQPVPKFNAFYSSKVEMKFDIDSIIFRTSGENLISMEHEEVPNRFKEEIVRDTDHESGNLLNFPTFPVTNEFASVCILDEKNIDISIVREKEEVPVDDIEIGEDHDVD